MVEKAPEKTVTYKGTQRISIPPHSSIEEYSIPNALCVSGSHRRELSQPQWGF